MDTGRFIQQVQDRAGLDGEMAWRVVGATLDALGRRLDPLHADAVARQLPDDLQDMLHRHPHGSARDDVDAFYGEVAALEAVDPAFAREHAQVVCQVLAEAVDDEGLRHLRADFSDGMAELFTRRPAPGESAPPAHPVAPPPPHHTLSDGRPGSTHPVSEAAPPRGHSESVARTPHPHEDTKLSSATGTTQERLHRTLGEGHPGSNRPLSGA
ncbi:MAG: DUF2267 domain-containing protein [Myxococcota bacterium]